MQNILKKERKRRKQYRNWVACLNHITWEARSDKSLWLWGLPDLHSEILFQRGRQEGMGEKESLNIVVWNEEAGKGGKFGRIKSRELSLK